MSWIKEYRFGGGAGVWTDQNDARDTDTRTPTPSTCSCPPARRSPLCSTGAPARPWCCRTCHWGRAAGYTDAVARPSDAAMPSAYGVGATPNVRSNAVESNSYGAVYW